MEVDDGHSGAASAAAELLLSPDPTDEDHALMMSEDGDGEGQLGKEDVDRLLAGDDEDDVGLGAHDGGGGVEVHEGHEGDEGAGGEKHEVEGDGGEEATGAGDTSTASDSSSSSAAADSHGGPGGGGYRGDYHGGYRGRGRFFRGGPMGLMRGGGAFYPPRPPFGPRPPPPFMRPPIGFRGPPRHPMMRGPPHPGMHPRDPRFRMYPPGGGPPRMRGPPPHAPARAPAPSEEPLPPAEEAPPAESSPSAAAVAPSSSSSSSGGGPTPLMSIETPDMVRAVVDQKIHRERAGEYAKRQELAGRRMGAGAGPPPGPPVVGVPGRGMTHPVGGVRGTLKRSYSQHISGSVSGPPPTSDQPAAKYAVTSHHHHRGHHHHHGAPPPSSHHHHHHQPPPSTQQPPQASTVVRSNLRQIQCVDEQQPRSRPPPQATSSAPVGGRMTGGSSNLITLTHHPSPTRITIDTSGGGARQHSPAVRRPPGVGRNGNLAAVPAAASSVSSRPARAPGCRVLIANLPQSATFDRLSHMTTSCGAVKTMQMDEGRAVIEFKEADAARKFYAQNNRKMMDLSILNIRLV